MKKVLLFVLVSIFVANTQAQTSWGLKAGMNLATVTDIDSELEQFKKNLPNFYITGFADIPVAPNFSVQPGVSLQGKGTKLSGEIEGTRGELTANVMSIEVPVNAVYYIPAGPGNVFLGAGPYIGFHLTGKLKTKVNGETTEDIDLNFSGDDRHFNRIDAGINFMGGYKLNNGVLFNVGYGLGLSDISPDEEIKSSHRVLSFGVGYQF